MSRVLFPSSHISKPKVKGIHSGFGSCECISIEDPPLQPPLTGTTLALEPQEAECNCSSCGGHCPCWPGLDLLDSRGGILIGVIISMVIFAVLGVALISITSTPNLGQVGSDFSTRAFYLAEAGYRYAAGQYFNTTTTFARDQRLETLNDESCALQGSTGSFALAVYPYWFVTSQAYANGQASISAKVPGEFSPEGYVVPGTLDLKIGPDIYPGCTLSQTQPRNVTITIPGGLRVVNPSSTPPNTLPQGTSVYLVFRPSSQTVTSNESNDNLVIPTSHYTVFPAKNGKIEIDGEDYVYRERQNTETLVTLSDLKKASDPSSSFSISLNTSSNVIIKKFIDLRSTGTVGSDGMQVQRTIMYATPINDLLQQSSLLENQNVLLEDFTNLNNWAVAGNDNSITIQGYIAQGGTHRYWLAIHHLPNHQEWDPDNSKCKIQHNEALLKSASAGGSTLKAMQQAWAEHGGLLSYDVQLKIGWGYLLQYGAGGICFRWREIPGSPKPMHEGYGLSFLRYGTRYVCQGNNKGDYVPNAMKPPGKQGKVLLVLWQQRVVSGEETREWLAYADLGNPSDRSNARDPKVVGNQWQYDGRINDNATLLVRIEEKIIDGFRTNDIRVFYGDASTNYTRTRNAVANDIAHRGRYSPSWLDSTLWSKWPTNLISSWASPIDYFTFATETPPAPENTLFWTLNPSADSIQLVTDSHDGSPALRTATFTTAEFPDSRNELGVHAYGDIGNDMNYSIAFDDFGVQLLGGSGGNSGGNFLPPIQF